MQVAPVSSTDPTAAASNASTSDAATAAFGLSFDALLKIILTQLTYQDPLKPMDNYQFVSQLAQFSQIQIGQTTNDKLTALVSAQGSDAGVVTGTVSAVSFSSGTPLLTIETTNGQTISSISLANISQIREAD
jgi:flagellar basal-body rod modification protein FlgD